MATNLPREVFPNPAAGKNVVIDSKGYTNVVPNGASVPYTYVLNTELTNGIYKIVLLSNSPQTICGRWAGVVTSANKGIKVFNIDPLGIDKGTVQIGSRGIKANGDWLYLNTSQLQIPNFWSGPVELALELQIGSAGNKLYASVNGNWLQRAVTGINQPVYFVYEVYDTLNLQIVSFQKLTSSSINPSVSYIYYDANLPGPIAEEPVVVSRSFGAPPVAAPPPGARSPVAGAAPTSVSAGAPPPGARSPVAGAAPTSGSAGAPPPGARSPVGGAAPPPVAAAPPPPPPVPIVTVNVQGGDINVDQEKVIITGTWVVVQAAKTQQKTPVVKAVTTKNGWIAKWGTNLVYETSSINSLDLELWFNDEDGEPSIIGKGSAKLSSSSGPVAVKIYEQEDNEWVATINVVLTYGTK